MINKLRNYEEVYANLINDLTDYVGLISVALDEIGGDVHSDVWDRNCEHRNLWKHDLSNVHNSGGFIAYFNYHNLYDNDDDTFRVIVKDYWDSMNFKEIAKDIVTRSAALLASEKNFEISSLKRRLKHLESD